VSEFHDIACGNGLKEKREKDSTKKIRRNNIRWREKDSEDSKTSTSENIREHSALPITCSEVSDTFPLKVPRKYQDTPNTFHQVPEKQAGSHAAKFDGDRWLREIRLRRKTETQPVIVFALEAIPRVLVVVEVVKSLRRHRHRHRHR
jgi:hypothetical protein